jgi:hypothetical protein
MLREATCPPAAVNVLDVSSESMAAFQVFMYGRFWVFTEVLISLLFSAPPVRLITSFSLGTIFVRILLTVDSQEPKAKARFSITNFF